TLYDIGSSVPVRRHRRVTRRDLLLQTVDLGRWNAMPKAGGKRESADVQLTLDLGPGDDTAPLLSGLPEMTGAERVRAELDVLGLDASRHVIDFYVPLLNAVGAVRARQLLTCRSKSEVLVAGVKVATQTPPIRSGRRVVFVTLDDATGPIDATFFEDAQGPYAATLFHSWLLLVRGEVRRTGPRGVSLRATGCWELSSLFAAWESGGLAAVDDLLAAVPAGFVSTPQDEGDESSGAGNSRESTSSNVSSTRDKGVGGGMGRRRVLVHPSGFRQSPYADVQPPGEDTKKGKPPRKLWHSSPGSSGG
ncbi:MAG TPA: OB-fold nucleic acid binding domain-containing protein, partial [Actinomycetes bacterium]|nr:OB-fold nucleic acid binding domain-containing protein [Actinomycetes bacterium]